MGVYRIGILGGTFNPIHIAHLRVAEEVAESLDLDKIIFIPAYRPPHKSEHLVYTYEHRLSMLRLAVEDHPRFDVSDAEKKLEGISYSVRTISFLKSSFPPPNTEMFFIIGADAFLEIETWWNYRELFRMVHFAIMTRPGHSHEEIVTFMKEHISSSYTWYPDQLCFRLNEHGSVCLIPVTHLDISASRIRKLLRTGKSIRYLVPEKVRAYIYKHKLYTTYDISIEPIKGDIKKGYECW